MPRNSLAILDQPEMGLPAGTKTIGKVRQDWLFGKPTLQSQGNGIVEWVRGQAALATHQKGGTGWVARLYGGSQTGWDDAAALYIPVNELPLPEFLSAQWSYHLQQAEPHGCNIGLVVHDPLDPSRRIELNQSGAAVLLGKIIDWNTHVLNFETPAQFFYYGEPDPIPNANLTKGPANLYKLSDFLSDNIFKTWKIFRISFNTGFYSTGTFLNCHLAEIILNGEVIPLGPSPDQPGNTETKSIYKVTGATSTTKVVAITPTAGKRVRIRNVFAATAHNTGALFECFFGTEADITVAPAKAIFSAWLDLDGGSPSARMPYGEKGPLGLPDEVVNIRTSVDIGTAGTFVIVYSEE